MRYLLASFFFRLFGWKLQVIDLSMIPGTVMVAAPHTSNWDFPIALFAFWKMRIPFKYFIKDSYTKSPLGWFFKWTGAIGVDRSRLKNNLVEYAAELLKKNPKMVILVPAEGTRKRVDRWKTGFYHIAMKAGVNITLGFADYEKKTAGVLGVLKPSGVFEKDMSKIQEQYKNIKGKYPELYNEKIF
ncbi:MAG: 1-acyl-sn-glycerol-3-phosphate acyltransferase [Thermaurantimonas sp.]